MATKRSASQVHPSRQDQVPSEPRRKRQKPNNAGPKSFKKAHPVNELKNQVRSLKRLLERNESLPANVRVEKERALQTTQHELEEAQQAQKRSDMIGKYHKVRFFDRKKAMKRLKQAQKELRAHQEDDVVRVELVKAVDDAEVEVNYAQYCPLDQPYFSLFPRKKAEKEDGEGEEGEDGMDQQYAAGERKGDEEMWQQVKQCMMDGTLEALRNGKLVKEPEEAPRVDTARKKESKHGKDAMAAGSVGKIDQGDARAAMQAQSGDESDGGFFE